MNKHYTFSVILAVIATILFILNLWYLSVTFLVLYAGLIWIDQSTHKKSMLAQFIATCFFTCMVYLSMIILTPQPGQLFGKPVGDLILFGKKIPWSEVIRTLCILIGPIMTAQMTSLFIEGKLKKNVSEPHRKEEAHTVRSINYDSNEVGLESGFTRPLKKQRGY